MGSIIKEMRFKNGLLHGMVIEFNENGKANLNLYFMNGKEFYDADEFYRKFYKKGVTYKGKTPVIELDKLEEAGDDDGLQTVELWEEGPYEEHVNLDTLNTENGVVKLTAKISKADFNSESKAIDKITLKVVVSKDGYYILSEHRGYKAANDEMMLFVEDNTGDFSGQQLGFRVGKNIKTALQNGSLRVSEVVKFFQERVFDKKFLPAFRTSDALEEEFK